MARPQEFNRDKALSGAVQCFWQKGFSETSMSDLLKAMSVSRSSFYNSFGDKNEVFREVLSVYGAQVNSLIKPTLLNSNLDPWGAIRAFFELTLLNSNAEMTSKGCLLVNTLSESAIVNPEYQELAKSLMKPVEQGLISCLGRAFSEKRAQEHGQWLFTQLLGWRIQSQSGLEKSELVRQVSWSIELLKNQIEGSHHVA